MRTFFIAIATICRFFTQDIWEKQPVAKNTEGQLNYCLEGKN